MILLLFEKNGEERHRVKKQGRRKKEKVTLSKGEIGRCKNTGRAIERPRSNQSLRNRERKREREGDRYSEKGGKYR